MKIIITTLVVSWIGLARCADSDSALRDVRDRIAELGLVEEFNTATEEIVGVGSASASVDENDCERTGFFETSIKLFAVARSKAAAEISKVLSTNLSASRVLGQISRPGLRYRALASVVKVRTEGRPIGCKVIARSVKKHDGKIQVSVALKWSLKMEEDTVRSFVQPQFIDEEDLRNWAENNDMILNVGPYLWSDDKGRVCFMGIGVCEIKREDSANVKNGMRIACARARRYLAQCFLESLSAEETVCKKPIAKITGGDVVLSDIPSNTVDINSIVKGVMPGIKSIYCCVGGRSPFTGKRLCVSVYALSVESAMPEIQKCLSSE